VASPSPLVRWTNRAAIIALILPLLFLAASWFTPWSEFNCWHEDIDLHTGRIRTQWYVCFVCVSEQIQGTAFSRAVTEGVAVDPPNWQRVNTFSPGVHYSPHYRFHGAITDLQHLEQMWELGRFTPHARRSSGERLLQIWQQSGNYFGSHDYLELVGNIAIDNFDAQRETTLDQLPR
jgi:hypothetical protein